MMKVIVNQLLTPSAPRFGIQENLVVAFLEHDVLQSSQSPVNQKNPVTTYLTDPESKDFKRKSQYHQLCRTIRPKC
jgi:hypothetical protein